MRLFPAFALCLGLLSAGAASAQGFAQQVASVSLIEGWRQVVFTPRQWLTSAERV